MADEPILFFDTETTGFAKYNLPLEHTDQPHTVQLAAQLCKPDASIISSMNLVVAPGVSIPKQASDVHGISDEHAAQFGVTPMLAARMFRHLYSRAGLVVGHNVKFDISVIGTLLARQIDDTRLDKPTYCTMEAAKPIVDLPPTERMRAAGFNKPKPPRLEECVQYFFGEALEGAHDAMVDVEACKRVYFHMQLMERENV